MQKRIIAIIGLLCTVSTGQAAFNAQATGQVSITANRDGVSATCAFSSIQTQEVILEGQTFQRLSIDAEGSISLPGGLELPAWSRWIEIPHGTSPLLELELVDDRLYSGINLPPGEISSFASDSNRSVTDLSNAIYSTDAIFPVEPATLTEPVVIGDKRYILLDITPYRYNPARKELHVAHSFNLQVKFEPDNKAEPIKRYTAPAWREVERGLSDENPIRDRVNSRVDHLGRYVIILPNNQQAIQAVQPLVEWKKRKGYLVTVVTTAQAGNTAAAITSYLTDAWNNWDVPPTYVLLAADSQGELSLPYYYDNAGAQQSWFVSDQQFVSYEGEGDNNLQTWLPEAFIGRLPAASVQELQQMVAKIIGYERTPYMGSNWIEGGVMMAQGVRSCIHVNVAIREMMMKVGYSRDRIFETLIDYNSPIDQNLVDRGVDEGVGFVNFRGYNNWGDYSTYRIRDRRNTWKLPVVFGMVCETNNFTRGTESIGEAWVKAWLNNNPAGAVACYGPTDLYTHTAFNNTHDAELFHQLLNRGVHSLGPLTILGKLSLYRNYPSARSLGNGLTVGYYFYTYNLLGDPSLQLWSFSPRRLSVDYTDNLPRGATRMDFFVTDEDSNPIADAYVHILVDNDLRYGGYTDGNGRLSIPVPPLEDGDYLLTVTGANLHPFEGEIHVGQVDSYASLASVEFNDTEEELVSGNGDGVFNPGETVEITTVLLNSGTDYLHDLSLVLSTDNRFVTVDIDATRIDEIAPEQSASGVPFLVSLAPGTPHGTVLDFDLTVISGNNTFETSFVLPVVGYRFSVEQVRFAGDQNLLPGSTQQMIISLINSGNLDTDTLNATLYCSDQNIQILQADAVIDAIPRNESRSNIRHPFEVYASSRAYIGTTVNFGLLLSDYLGRRDSLIVPVSLGPATVISPQGPDDYGYWAFDDRDTLTGMAPVYVQFSGTQNLNLYDADDTNNQRGDHGQRAIVNLPFEFVFYGEHYNRVTICSNGWMAFGETDQIAWSNQEMGSGFAPPAMVAPWWEDLHSGSVFTRYDQEAGRFIVEWRNFQTAMFGGPYSFSVVLYDPTTVFTRTGDGEIFFYYNQIPEQRDYNEERATVGICSHDRQSLLQIRFATEWHPASAGIITHRAIRFTTGGLSEFGGVTGRVTDFAGGSPMANVRVMLDGTGFYALSDLDGNFRIEDAPVGTYSVTARRRYYNDATEADIQVFNDQYSEVYFSLTYPTYASDIEAIDISVPPGYTDSTFFNIWNEGNGPLDYKLSLNYEAERDMPWDVMFNFNASQICSSNTWLNGVTTDGEYFYISAKSLRGDLPHLIYVLNRDGELQRQFEQHTVDTSTIRGYFSIDWNGQNLLAVEKNNIIELTTGGQLVRTIPSPERPGQSIAWAPERESMFIKGLTGNFFIELDVNGNVIASFRTPETFRTYGLAWHPADPDDYNLYIFRSNSNILPEFGTQLQIWKMNPATGDFQLVRNLVSHAVNSADNTQDCAITKKWDPLKWCFVALLNRSAGDQLIGFELGPNLTWISYDPKQGSVEPGSQQTFNLRFSPEDMPERYYFVVLELQHNARGNQQNIPVYFNVGWDKTIDPAVDLNPGKFTIESAFPNPFNPTVTLKFSLINSVPVEFTLWDVHGRLVMSSQLGYLGVGNHSVSVNGADLSSGVYLAKIQAGAQTATTKLLLLR